MGIGDGVSSSAAQPGSFGRKMNIPLFQRGKRRVERAQRKRYPVCRIAVATVPGQGGSTRRAERPGDSGRRIAAAQDVSAVRHDEIIHWHAAIGAEGGAMRFSVHAAMAVRNRLDAGVNFVPHCAAQAASKERWERRDTFHVNARRAVQCWILPCPVAPAQGCRRARTKRSMCDAVWSGAASLRNRAHGNAMNFGKRSRIRRSSLALLPGR